MRGFLHVIRGVIFPFDRYLTGNSLKARLLRGALWLSAGSVSLQVLNMTSSILSARILGQTGFGELGLVRSTMLMFGVIAGTGLSMTTTKYVAQYRNIDPVRAGRFIGLLSYTALILGGSVFLICLVLAAPLAQWVMNAPQLASALRVGCLLLLLNTFNGVQIGVLSGIESFGKQSKLTVIDGFLNLMFIPMGAWFLGVTGALGGSVLAATVSLPIKQRIAQKECLRCGIKILYRGVLGEVPILWKFALPAVLVGMSIQPFEWLTRLRLARQPEGFAELGVFTAVFSWAQLIFFIPGMVLGPTMSIMANLHSEGRIAQLKKLVISSQFLVLFFAVVTAIPLAFLSPYILRAYGSGFASGKLTLLIMLGAYVVSVTTIITRSFFAALGHMWWQTVHTILWGVLLITIFIFITNYGALGLAFSYLGAYLVFTFVQLGTMFIIMNKLSVNIS